MEPPACRLLQTGHFAMDASLTATMKARPARTRYRLPLQGGGMPVNRVRRRCIVSLRDRTAPEIMGIRPAWTWRPLLLYRPCGIGAVAGSYRHSGRLRAQHALNP